MLEPDDIAGAYRVEARMGEGGFSTTYRVVHSVLGSHHALTVLDPELARDEPLRARFLDEGRIQAQLRHPNLVSVTDLVSEPDIAGLVTELVSGPTLADRLEELGGPMPLSEIREILEFWRILEILQTLTKCLVGSLAQNCVAKRDGERET